MRCGHENDTKMGNLVPVDLFHTVVLDYEKQSGAKSSSSHALDCGIEGQIRLYIPLSMCSQTLQSVRGKCASDDEG